MFKTKTGVTVIFLVLLIFVDAMFYQIQIYLIGGIMFQQIVWKLLLFLLYLATFTIRTSTIAPLISPVSLYVFGIYLLVDAIFLNIILGLDVFMIIISFVSRFFFLFFAWLIQSQRIVVNEKLVFNSFLFLGIPLLTLGIFQYYYKEPFVAVNSGDGIFKVYSIDFLDDYRAFSLFSAPLNFGLFLTFCSLICLYEFLYLKKRLFIIFYLLFIYGCYITLTRNVYLTCLFSNIFLILFKYKPQSRLLRIYPLLMLIVGYSVIIYSTTLATLFTTNAADNSSLLLRLQEWQYFYKLIDTSWEGSILFGLGIIQNSNFKQFEDVLIDNDLLSLILNIGLIGAILYYRILWDAWKNMTTHLVHYEESPTLPIVALYCVTPLYGVFNIAITLTLMLILFVMIAPKDIYMTYLKNRRSNL